jgi:hypothetical protein
MNSRSEKISLLSELIAFALIDGELHDKEFDFLKLLSQELGIEKPAFIDLFRKRDEIIPIKDNFNRIVHFYQLSLLMYCDEIVHKYEDVSIHKIGLKLGLNPTAMNRVLNLMKNTPNHILPPEKVICIFEEQLN